MFFSHKNFWVYTPPPKLRRKRTPLELVFRTLLSAFADKWWPGGPVGLDDLDKVCKMSWKIFMSCFAESRVKEDLRLPPPH